MRQAYNRQSKECCVGVEEVRRNKKTFVLIKSEVNKIVNTNIVKIGQKRKGKT